MIRVGTHTAGKNYIDGLDAFVKGVGFVPSPFNMFVTFGSPFPAAACQAVVAAGAIPFITLMCNNVARVASGMNDGYYTAFFKQIDQFGKPVYVRTFHEMNDQGIHTCNTALHPALFLEAWKRIVGIARKTASNAKLVWCPSARANPAALDPFYPGKDWVDVIGFDEYANGTDGTFKTTFDFPGSFAHFAGQGVPFMLCETAATQAYQVQYIDWLSTTLPTIPGLAAVMWWDSTGGSKGSHPGFTWNLGADGARAYNALDVKLST